MSQCVPVMSEVSPGLPEREMGPCDGRPPGQPRRGPMQDGRPGRGCGGHQTPWETFRPPKTLRRWPDRGDTLDSGATYEPPYWPPWPPRHNSTEPQPRGPPAAAAGARPVAVAAAVAAQLLQQQPDCYCCCCSAVAETLRPGQAAAEGRRPVVAWETDEAERCRARWQ